MNEPSSPNSTGMPKNSKPLSDEEWEHVDEIRTFVGCLNCQMSNPSTQETVKAILTKAQEKGLDPERIYRCAVNPHTPITRRIPAWDKVKPEGAT